MLIPIEETAKNIKNSRFLSWDEQILGPFIYIILSPNLPIPAFIWLDSGLASLAHYPIHSAKNRG